MLHQVFQVVEFFDNLTKGFISQTVEVCIQDEDVVEARKVSAQTPGGDEGKLELVGKQKQPTKNDFR